MNWPPAAGAVLVTGASSGIGKACVDALIHQRVHVFAGVRSEQDALRLQQRNVENLTPVLLDVTESSSITSAIAYIGDAIKGRHLIGLVNNAGVMVSGPLELVPQQDLRAQMEVNVIGQMAVTRACLPMLRSSRGRIVNIGSTSGHIPAAFTGPYCASKFALLALTDVLRMELRPFGIHVAIVEPGVIATPIWDKVISKEEALRHNMSAASAALYGASLVQRRQLLTGLKSTGAAPEKVAAAVTHALLSRRPKSRYVPGVGTKIRLVAAKLLPNQLRDALKYLRARLRGGE